MQRVNSLLSLEPFHNPYGVHLCEISELGQFFLVVSKYMLFCQIANYKVVSSRPWINGTYYMLLHVVLLIYLYVGICDSLAGESVIG